MDLKNFKVNQKKSVQ